MGLRGRMTIGAFLPAEGQTTTHIQAGTMGRLLRACMNFVRVNPDWYPVGQIEKIDGGKQVRQKLVKHAS